MDLSSYAEYAVRLVNTSNPATGEEELTSVERMREVLPLHSQAVHAATAADLPVLREVRAGLREVFEQAAAGRQAAAVAALNTLLARHPVSPQVSGHDRRGPDGRPDWHIHLAEHADTPAAAYAAVACMGLAIQATALGLDRLGTCQASRCSGVFVDTSTNRSRRYCSDRCATRANVAAYRARKRRESTAGRGR
ncbi:CGNR zinc finger domain-containing protein [Allostreptomyces psammosilenae]|uniref:Putative RNA-binding Zn ribbon-like protein n=1 Tax=Allostreptomyces psammosilenae TaxID=1892865 RepID=A0A852ZVA3_9ACTN|nr:CGNR zinc finger domain-containing protein [Allostreptomyces psammosilenae]NYI06323.1 putative RNA-binding Zn ribbon-like protein [Allostreptomyces psammosilenae]